MTTEYVEEIVPLRFERITRPDRPGIWAFAGWKVEAPETEGVVRVTVNNPIDHQPGWWSFLMDLPGGRTVSDEENGAKKKTVWRMWVVPVRETPWSCATLWLPEGQQPSLAEAIRTDKTEEREQ